MVVSFHTNVMPEDNLVWKELGERERVMKRKSFSRDFGHKSENKRLYKKERKRTVMAGLLP